MLNEVVITASQDIPIEQKTEMSIVSIPIKQVKLLHRWVVKVMF